MSEDMASAQSGVTAIAANGSGSSTSKRRVKSLKSCNVCGRGFIKLAHLIRHARTHGNERPFSCSKCDKAFARTDALQRHDRAVHSGASASAGRDDTSMLLAGSPESSLSSHEDAEPEGEGEAGRSSALTAAPEAPGRTSGSANKKRKASADAEPSVSNRGQSSNSPQMQSQAEDFNNVYHPDFRILLGLDQASSDTRQQQAQAGPSYTAEPVSVTQKGNISYQDTTQSLNYGPSNPFGVPDFAMPSASSASHSTTQNQGQAMPIASFMASFTPSHPNASSTLDATIDSWLTQEGGSHAAENALEMVFSHDLFTGGLSSVAGCSGWDNSMSAYGPNPQNGHHVNAGTANNHTSSGAFSNLIPMGYDTPSANNSNTDSGMSKLYPFGLQFEDIWKSSPPASQNQQQQQQQQYQFDGSSLTDSGSANANSMSGPSKSSNSTQSQFTNPFSSDGTYNPAGNSTVQHQHTNRPDPTARNHQNNRNQASHSSSTSLPPLPSISVAQYTDSASTASSSSPRRKVLHRVLTTDTWLNSMKMPEDGFVDLPQPDITSPEQVMGELSVETSIDKASRTSVVKGDQAAIPSMKFLDSCLHLYFRDFHPTYPILHKPTFCRHRCPPLLLLSMCSIGCIFMGTQSAREKGLWIYERLHHVIVFSRDSRMTTEHARVAMTLSGLLGQCFSFLYGQPKHMFTAESFHGCLCTFARRAGLFKLIDKNAISYDMVADLDEDALEARWQEWARREMLRRVALGLAIHAADAATYSLLPRLVPVQLSMQDQSSDALFEAEDASSWKWLLLCLSGASPNNATGTPPSSGFQVVPTADTMFPMAIMAQKIVNTLQLKEMCRSEMAFVSNFTDIVLFYKDMLNLASRLGISEDRSQHPRQLQSSSSASSKSSANQAQILKVMWHYCCLAKLARLDQIEEVAGREGVPQQHTIEAVRQWVRTPEARLATLHAAHVLHQAADLKDLAFIVPRAIFQSTLLLLCFIAFNEPVIGRIEFFDATEVTDWEHFAKVVAECSANTSATMSRDGESSMSDLHANLGLDFVVNGRPLMAERWIRQNSCRWRLDKFIDGKEKQMDYVSLLSTTTRLLRRCTPWGIGDAMGDILATINIGH